jgi:hypothetical protein
MVALQAAKTRMIMGNISDKVILKFRVIRVVVVKIDSIIPSRHRVRKLGVIDRLMLLVGMVRKLRRG